MSNTSKDAAQQEEDQDDDDREIAGGLVICRALVGVHLSIRGASSSIELASKRLFLWVQFRTSTLALLFRVSDREWDIPSSTSAPCAAWLPSIIGSLPDGDPGVLGAIPPIGEL